MPSAPGWTIRGASAYYREVDAPFTFYAYFPPHLEVPSAEGLKAFEGVLLLEAETFADEDWLEKEPGGLRVLRGWQDLLHQAPLGRGSRSLRAATPIVVNPGLAFWYRGA